MIYMEPTSLGWEPLMYSWLNTLPPVLHDLNKKQLLSMFMRFCEPLFWLTKKGFAKVIINDIVPLLTLLIDKKLTANVCLFPIEYGKVFNEFVRLFPG